MTRELEVGGGQPFGGETYNPEEDKERLLKQLAAVKKFMLAARRWRTLAEIGQKVGAPQQSVSARLRDLRKAKFGSYTVLKRNLGGGLWEYIVLTPEELQRTIHEREVL